MSRRLVKSVVVVVVVERLWVRSCEGLLHGEMMRIYIGNEMRESRCRTVKITWIDDQTRWFLDRPIKTVILFNRTSHSFRHYNWFTDIAELCIGDGVLSSHLVCSKAGQAPFLREMARKEREISIRTATVQMTCVQEVIHSALFGYTNGMRYNMEVE